MKQLVVAAAVLAGALVFSPSAAQAAQAAHFVPPHYRIIDLGVVDDGSASQAFGVSPHGLTAVGRVFTDSGFPAFYWTRGTGPVALPNLQGRSYAQANAVNAKGMIVGTSTTTSFGSGALPVSWVDGVITEYKLPPGQDVGRAVAVNSRGIAAGSVGGDVDERAAVFRHGGTEVITTTTSDGKYMAYATGITDEGLVAGSGIDPNNAALNVGLVYDATTDTMTDIGALDGDNGSLVFGISNAGYAVGSSMVYQGSGTPFVWSAKRGMVAIPLPPKTSEGSAYGVNDYGWAVGNGGGLYSVPFLYVHGHTFALARLIPQNPTWDLDHNTSSSALAITNRGTIVGTAVHHGETHAYAMVIVRGSLPGAED
jgi:uncharacterized membrane protein